MHYLAQGVIAEPYKFQATKTKTNQIQEPALSHEKHNQTKPNNKLQQPHFLSTMYARPCVKGLSTSSHVVAGQPLHICEN